MPTSAKKIIDAIEQLAPLSLATDWDRSGVQISVEWGEKRGVLVALDVTEETVQEAYHTGMDFLLTHHPLLFSYDIKNGIRDDEPTGALIVKLIENGITVYAAHTSYDAAPGGMNDALAGALGLEDAAPLAPDGEAAMVRIGRLPMAMPFDVATRYVSEKLQLNGKVRTVGDPHELIHTVAICGGAGGDFMAEAYKAGADLYITGDVRHHEGILAASMQRCLIDAGHAALEKIFVPAMTEYLRGYFGDDINVLEVLDSQADPDPFRFPYLSEEDED
ncbi:MAG: Nif3-like dinuclear metal center hexameric protein [Clostridiales Family XIII bacterium]|jgi:dinuclear metal center YbgI/SA1388 family protein|nr:Nif3-like dinuclear metal center hexameric protein [Clostridiales Family XIII bacterium]